MQMMMMMMIKEQEGNSYGEGAEIRGPVTGSQGF